MPYDILQVADFDELFLSSTSKGNAKKFISSNRKYFIKCNTRLQIGEAYDAYAEIVASNIEKILGISGVGYTPAYMNGEFVCKSANFCSRDEVFITYETLAESEDRDLQVIKTSIDRYYNVLETIHEITGIDATEAIDTMICLDYLICNCDRHFNNFGVVKNLATGAVRLAPIFDNGMCLGSLGGYLRDAADYTRLVEAKPFSSNFDAQLDLVLRKPFNFPDSFNEDEVFDSLEEGLPRRFVMDLLSIRLEALKKKFGEG